MPKAINNKNIKTAWKRSGSNLSLKAWARSQDGINWLLSFRDSLEEKHGEKWASVLEHGDKSGELTIKAGKVSGHS